MWAKCRIAKHKANEQNERTNENNERKREKKIWKKTINMIWLKANNNDKIVCLCSKKLPRCMYAYVLFNLSY